MSVPSQKQEVFTKAYEEYGDSLFRFCLSKLSNRDKALDAVQDVFAKTWRYLEQDKEIGNMRSFLYTTAYHIIVDSYRRKQSESLDSMRDEGFDIADDKGEIPLLSIETEKILGAVRSLDDSYRDVVMMRYIHELTPKEIAEITGLSENVVSVRIYRGLEKLREILKING